MLTFAQREILQLMAGGAELTSVTWKNQVWSLGKSALRPHGSTMNGLRDRKLIRAGKQDWSTVTWHITQAGLDALAGERA